MEIIGVVKVSKKLSNGSIKMGYNSEIEPMHLHHEKQEYKQTTKINHENNNELF